MSAGRAFITTPIYYVNDRPHIGHTYTTTLCDVWARATRLMGRETFFLTGTDEHGQKVEKSAREAGVSPQKLADTNAAEFRRVMDMMEFSHDDFIRTTEPRHMTQVQALVGKLAELGVVYLGEFEGWYDEGQEEYHTETRARELDYKSPVSGRPLVRFKEQNYYFRLSAFQQRLEEFYSRHPEFVQPEGRFNEVKGRLREGLQDVPVTRTNFSWGIPFPGDPNHVIYVWIDALINYVSALGLAKSVNGAQLGPGAHLPEVQDAPAPAAAELAAQVQALHQSRGVLWPADLHVVGKEILWFHAVIWPAMLMALELEPPRQIHAHSFWIRDGQKMSKSMGNFLDLAAIEAFIARYGLDAWRWYMATQGPLQATDADFRAAHFHEVYTAELVNLVGNCASRVGAMIAKYCDGRMPADTGDASQWVTRCAEATAQWRRAIEALDLTAAARAGLDLLRAVDAFIHQTEPFKLAKDPANSPQVHSILAQCAQCVRVAGLLLAPFLPTKMDELARGFGEATPSAVTGRGCCEDNFAARIEYGRIAVGTPIAKLALFPRLDAPKAA